MNFRNLITRKYLLLSALLLVPVAMFANTTNVIGTYGGDTFESFTAGDSIIGQGGWYADTNEVTAVVSNGPPSKYMAVEAGSYGLTNIFDLQTTLTNVVIEMDVMMNPADDIPSVVSNNANHVAIWLATNGNLMVRHDVVPEDYFSFTTINTEMENYITAITNGQWINVKITMDYLNVYGGFLHFFKVEVDGNPAYTNALYGYDKSLMNNSFIDGNNATNHSGTPEWLCVAHMITDPAEGLSSVVLSGAGNFDNIYVTNLVAGGGGGSSYTVTVVQASNGTISPAGPETVSPGGNSQWYTITPDPNYYVFELVISGATNNTPSTNYQFTSMSKNETLSANFALDGAIAISNGTPQSWMQELGIFTNDYANAAGEDPDNDGISTADEYLGSTDPFDANSFLEVIDVGNLNGTNYVRWRSWRADTSLPPYGLQYKIDLAGGGGWTNAQGTVTRNGGDLVTNTWWETAPMPAAFYRVVATNTP